MSDHKHARCWGEKRAQSAAAWPHTPIPQSTQRACFCSLLLPAGGACSCSDLGLLRAQLLEEVEAPYKAKCEAIAKVGCGAEGQVGWSMAILGKQHRCRDGVAAACNSGVQHSQLGPLACGRAVAQPSCRQDPSPVLGEPQCCRQLPTDTL